MVTYTTAVAIVSVGRGVPFYRGTLIAAIAVVAPAIVAIGLARYVVYIVVDKASAS